MTLPSADALLEVQRFCERVKEVANNPDLDSNAGYFEGMELSGVEGSLLSAILPGAQVLRDSTGEHGDHYELRGINWYMLWNDTGVLGFWFTLRTDPEELHIPLRVWLSQPDIGEFDIYAYQSIVERVDFDQPHPIWEQFPLEALFRAYNQCLDRSLSYCENGANAEAKQELERWKFARNQRAIEMVEETSP